MKKRSITSIIVFLVALTAPCPDGLSQTQTRIYTSHERKQDEKEQREPSKTERRLTDEQADSLAFEKALNAIKQLNFVLEADYISSARMGTTYVDNGTNFVSVSDDRAVVQISPRSDIGGLNGVGGITLEGTASNIVMKTDKKGNVTVNLNVQGAGISASIHIAIPQGSNRATATVSPNYRSNATTLGGRLLPSEESNVFEGAIKTVTKKAPASRPAGRNTLRRADLQGLSPFHVPPLDL